MTNLIKEAVNPLKQVAMKRSELDVRERIALVIAELEKNDMDADKVAPYPSSFHSSRNSYRQGVSNYKFLHAFVSGVKSSRSFRDPHIVKINEERLEKFVAKTRENAGVQYDAYVAKLISKIGETTKATLDGDHVWGHSFLHVTTVSGEEQTWKTQMIINQSKFGLMFNQFPTRKIKRK